MTAKTKLLQKINNIENDQYLEALLNYLEESEKDPIQLSISDIESIQISSDQISRGEFFTQNELANKINGWLGK